MGDAAGWIEEMLVDVQGGAPESTVADGNVMHFSETLGRRVRSDQSWEDAAISTYVRVRDSIAEKDWDTAAEYLDFFYDEAAVIYGFFRQFIPDAITYLEGKGMTRDELVALNQQILGMLNLPDGRPFSARARWAEFQDQVRRGKVACGAKDEAQSLALLSELKETWRQIQDRDVDHLYGLLNEAVVRWGEPFVGEFFEVLFQPLFESRYDKFDVSKNPWDESLWTNVYLAFESMRGHLVGPDRDGSMEFTEDEERFTWRFDPCGSGGRSMRGDAIEGSPPRMESPFEYGVTKEEYDWAWNKKGVCYYCTNCCIVMQKMPIDNFGYPVRVVEPPTYPDNADVKCTWHVYKDPANVPERFYTDVGATKPEMIGGSDDSDSG